MKRAYIFGAGEYDGPPPVMEGDAIVLAADGGADFLSRYGIRPDLVLGDFDSLPEPPEGVALRRFPPEKDDTDMALAVEEALRQGAEELRLYGALGGRLDHTIANLQLLAGLARRGVRAYLMSARATVTAVHNGALVFPASFSGTVSVFAWGGTAAVTERGLKYSLTDYPLRDDVPLGVSNEFTGREAEVRVRNGTLVLMWQDDPGQLPGFKRRETMMLKGAIFDMDGTLLDSMPLWHHRGSDFMRENGMTPEPDIDKRFKEMSLRQSAEYFRDVCHIPGTVEEIIDRINDCVEKGYRTVLPKPGVREFLESLKESGVRLFLATATERRLVEGVMGRLDLLRYFDGLLTCGEVGASKAKPDIFDASLERLGTRRENTIIFEDAPHAIRTAVAAGYPVCCVEDPSYDNAREELRALSRWNIPDFRGLTAESFDSGL